MPEPSARLAVIHTVSGLVDLFRPRLADALPDVDVFHMLDESLLQDLIRRQPRSAITSRLASHVLAAEQAGATAVLFTCSSTSPLLEPIRAMVGIPLIKIDEAMAEAATHADGTVGLVCTTPSTEEPSTALIRSAAEASGRSVQIESIVVGSAFDALVAGRREEHDRLVREAARKLAGRCDRIVLAQASLAHLEKTIEQETSLPTFSSPERCIAALGARLAEGVKH